VLEPEEIGGGPMRIPPALDPVNQAYWTGGSEGKLLISHCQDCGWWNHPPTTICRACLSDRVLPEPVSGRGTVFTYTINHHAWSPTATAEPYVIAIVELDEQPGLRQITNVINCPIDQVHIGQRVEVVFRALADVALPLFEPARDQARAEEGSP
jgi:uncharacterized OB-fold protein